MTRKLAQLLSELTTPGVIVIIVILILFAIISPQTSAQAADCPNPETSPECDWLNCENWTCSTPNSCGAGATNTTRTCTIMLNGSSQGTCTQTACLANSACSTPTPTPPAPTIPITQGCGPWSNIACGGQGGGLNCQNMQMLRYRWCPEGSPYSSYGCFLDLESCCTTCKEDTPTPTPTIPTPTATPTPTPTVNQPPPSTPTPTAVPSPKDFNGQTCSGKMPTAENEFTCSGLKNVTVVLLTLNGTKLASVQSNSTGSFHLPLDQNSPYYNSDCLIVRAQVPLNYHPVGAKPKPGSGIPEVIDNHSIKWCHIADGQLPSYFYFSPTYWQSAGGDIRAETMHIESNLPPNKTLLEEIHNIPNSNGIGYSHAAAITVNQGNLSPNHLQLTNYKAEYPPSAWRETHYDYQYFLTNLDPNTTIGDTIRTFHLNGNQLHTKNLAALQPQVILVNGSLIVDAPGSSWSKHIFLVNGTLTINTNIDIPGSNGTFISQGDILVDNSVNRIEGIYITNGQFSNVANGSGDTSTQFNLTNGSIIAYTDLALGRTDAEPTEMFVYNPAPGLNLIQLGHLNHKGFREIIYGRETAPQF